MSSNDKDNQSNKKFENKENYSSNIDKLPALDSMDPLCEDIDSEHCLELRRRKFTDDPKDIFPQVYALERRYEYTIKTLREKNDQDIQECQAKNGEKYRNALKAKKEELNQELSQLNFEVNKNLKALEVQENVILENIREIYQKESQNLIEIALKILGLDI